MIHRIFDSRGLNRVVDYYFITQFAMSTRAVIFIKIAVYCILIIALSCLLYFDEKRIDILRLKYQLKCGTPSQKEAVLNIFMEEYQRSLVPSVINAILDKTPLPRHGDTGWGVVYHQAATAMCEFARLVDGKSQEERGRCEYSFYDDVGRASFARQKEIYTNWKRWWSENKNAKIKRPKDRQ